MRIKIMSLIIVVAITGISCSLFQSEVDDVEDLLPRETDVPGWLRSNPVSSYSGRNIKKYNKDYTELGIEKLSYSVYESIDNSDIKMKVEVIRFDSVLNAYGFYSVSRGYGIFDIGETNDFNSDRLSIIQIGNYVVCSSTDNESTHSLEEELKVFAKIPFNYIGENYMNYKLPDSLNILKSGDGYGIIYSINQHDKFSFLERIAYTQWKWNNNLINVFYSEYSSFYDAYEIFKKNIVDDFIVSSSDEIYTAFKKDDGKYIFISVKDRFIFGGWSIEDYNDIHRILNEILNRINDYNKKSVN